ncbi:MAG: biotin attachment protein [Chloroflexi bacterium]|nr:biotin attachment protein [Chloroflexota bacterium]MCL5075386.1 biotin attachment protein [Chloroflexota bacterium]
MAETIVMPKLGLTMTEGTLAKWVKNEGEAIQQDEVIAEVETDKITSDIAAPTSGILTRILVQPGETVPVGTPLAILASPGEIAEPNEG